MKKTYIKPETEIVGNEYLCGGAEPEAGWAGASKDPGTQYVGTRETEQFLEDDSNGKGFGYRRYNLWDN